MPGGGQGRPGRAGAVGRIAEHPHRGVLVVEQCQPDDGFVVVGAAGLGQRAVGDDPGVGFDRDVGFEAVLAAVHRLMGMAGLGIDGGDHPIGGHLLRDLPVPVGAIRALDGFDVLAGDQRQQRHRLGGPRPEFLLGQMPEQPMGIADQGVDQLIAGGLVVPGDRRFTRVVVVMGGAVLRRSLGGGGDLAARPAGSRRSAGSRCPGWPPRRRGPWNPTPAASCLPTPRSGPRRP